MKRMAIPSSAVLLFTLAFASPVLAAAPTNDTYAGATVIGALPYAETLDTTEATTDADDIELNTNCGAPATDASVWYSLTPAADTTVIVDVSSSNYPAGVLVGVGSPGSFSIVTCGPSGVSFVAASAETYSILVIDDQSDGSGNGGSLQLSVTAAPPPPEVDIAIDPLGTFDARTGKATIGGTITCGADAFAWIFAEVRQAVGRFTISGTGFTELPCDGTSRPWSIEIVPQGGQFKGGRAMSVVFGVACGFQCGTDQEQATIRLSR
jgi:hypothetical protein